ncbi:hypothetical protein, partial [Thermodesulfatator autotrophicus]|uniref:hypothetical protein n=1 Tax=Thermodesulfatator autotrophicus TaxID=1795632 RepID=UPI0018D347C0
RYVLDVAAPPRLLIDGVTWFGGGSTGWIQAKIRVSSSFSLAKAFEELRKSDEYRETVDRVERYAEKLEAEGKAVEAVRLRRRALKLMMAGKTRIDPASLVPLQ